MPRSGPGPRDRLRRRAARGRSSGASSPATMRSSVDLPQPEGPRMVTKSLSATARSVGSQRQRRRAAAHAGEDAADALDRRAARRLRTPRDRAAGSAHLNARSDTRPITPMHEDAEDHLPGVEQPLAVHDHVADARTTRRPARPRSRRSRPSRARGAGVSAICGAAPGSITRRTMPARVGAERVRGLDQVAPRRADDHRDHQDQLEHRADEDHRAASAPPPRRPRGSAAG